MSKSARLEAVETKELVAVEGGFTEVETTPGPIRKPLFVLPHHFVRPPSDDGLKIVPFSNPQYPQYI
jgi:hypothetical protein